MFKIDYKTVPENCLASDRAENLSSDMAVYCDTIYGDIRIIVNDSDYGCIFDIPPDNDYGDTVLDYWFSKLIEACMELKHDTKYTIKEIECSNLFLNFEKKDDSHLLVSFINSGEIKWTESIEYTELTNEVINKTERLVSELCEFDPRLAESAVVSGINSRLIKLKKELDP